MGLFYFQVSTGVKNTSSNRGFKLFSLECFWLPCQRRFKRTCCLTKYTFSHACPRSWPSINHAWYARPQNKHGIIVLNLVPLTGQWPTSNLCLLGAWWIMNNAVLYSIRIFFKSDIANVFEKTYNRREITIVTIQIITN